MAKLPDGRYTANPEYTGHLSGKPRHVARFCDERISDHPSKRAAISACITYEQERQNELDAENQRALDELNGSHNYPT